MKIKYTFFLSLFTICLFCSCEKETTIDTRITNFYGDWEATIVRTLVLNDSIISEASNQNLNYTFYDDFSGIFYLENNHLIAPTNIQWNLDLENSKLTLETEYEASKFRNEYYEMNTNRFDRIVFTRCRNSIAEPGEPQFSTTYKLTRNR